MNFKKDIIERLTARQLKEILVKGGFQCTHRKKNDLVEMLYDHLMSQPSSNLWDELKNISRGIYGDEIGRARRERAASAAPVVASGPQSTSPPLVGPGAQAVIEPPSSQSFPPVLTNRLQTTQPFVASSSIPVIITQSIPHNVVNSAQPSLPSYSPALSIPQNIYPTNPHNSSNFMPYDSSIFSRMSSSTSALPNRSYPYFQPGQSLYPPIHSIIPSSSNSSNILNRNTVPPEIHAEKRRIVKIPSGDNYYKVFESQPHLMFNESVFYETRDILVTPRLLHPETFTNTTEQSCSTHLTFELSQKHAEELLINLNHDGKSSIQFNLQVIARFALIDPSAVDGNGDLTLTKPLDDNLPQYLHVKVNDSSLSLHEYLLPSSTNENHAKGRRSPKPINLTTHLHSTTTKQSTRKMPDGTLNRISITWRFFKNYPTHYVMGVYLAYKIPYEKIARSLATERTISVMAVKEAIMSRLGVNTNEDDCVAVTHNLAIPLRCPLLQNRIRFPVRTLSCNHLKTFCLYNFLQMNDVKVFWKCSLCRVSAHLRDLYFDSFMNDVLSDPSTQDVDTVYYLPNGNWIIKPPLEEKVDETRSEKIMEPVKNLDPIVIDLCSDGSDSDDHMEIQSNFKKQSPNKKHCLVQKREYTIESDSNSDSSPVNKRPNLDQILDRNSQMPVPVPSRSNNIGAHDQNQTNERDNIPSSSRQSFSNLSAYPDEVLTKWDVNKKTPILHAVPTSPSGLQDLPAVEPSALDLPISVPSVSVDECAVEQQPIVISPPSAPEVIPEKNINKETVAVVVVAEENSVPKPVATSASAVVESNTNQPPEATPQLPMDTSNSISSSNEKEMRSDSLVREKRIADPRLASRLNRTPNVVTREPVSTDAVSNTPSSTAPVQEANQPTEPIVTVPPSQPTLRHGPNRENLYPHLSTRSTAINSTINANHKDQEIIGPFQYLQKKQMQTYNNNLSLPVFPDDYWSQFPRYTRKQLQ